MTRAILALVAASLALASTGCVGPAELGSYSKARAGSTMSRIEQIRAELARARAFAGRFTDFLPDAQRDRIEGLARRVDDALRAASAAASLVDQAAELRKADQALDEYRFAAGA